MAQDYSEYLAVAVLNEQQYVSYRLLSRALKVHSNVAKQMLYEFHRKQNTKKPGSVHATYLLAGTRRRDASSQTNGVDRDGDDTVMQSSPYLPSSSMPHSEADGGEEVTVVRSIVLAKEEDLEQARRTFEEVTSIHIYSLEASGPKDLHVLTECNRKIVATYASEDPLEAWKQYGTIHNPEARRRTKMTAPPPPISVSEPKAKPSVQSSKPSQADQSKPAPKTSASTAAPDSKAKAGPKPSTMRKQASDIFKSFAKGKTTVKKEDSQEAPTSAQANPADEPMGGFSDDEGDEAGDLTAADETSNLPEGKSRKEREADLQAMMEQEDEPMDDADSPSVEKPQEDEGAIDEAEQQKEEEPKETVAVENGRRRGRRRVMKKKTVKDEDGYLVTKEEAAWESFSEEEPAPKKIKAPVVSGGNAGAKAGKKGGGKPGQGNIMSFFAKK